MGLGIGIGIRLKTLKTVDTTKTDAELLADDYCDYVLSQSGSVDYDTVVSIYEEILEDDNAYNLASYCDLRAGKQLATGYTDEYWGVYDMIHPYRLLSTNEERRFGVDENGLIVYTTAFVDIKLYPKYEYLIYDNKFSVDVNVLVRLGDVTANNTIFSILSTAASVFTMQIRATERGRNYINCDNALITHEPLKVGEIGSEIISRLIIDDGVNITSDYDGGIISTNITTQGLVEKPDDTKLHYIEIGRGNQNKIKKWWIYIPINPLTNDYLNYLERDDIDNLVTNALIDETQNITPEFIAQSFTCPVKMDNETRRRAFPTCHYYNGYSFITYLAGNSHSPNALLPYKLEFVRSNDLFINNVEVLPIKCINDEGTMREIIPYTDGFFPNHTQFGYAGGKLYMYMRQTLITTLPPTLSTQIANGKTYVAYSEDMGDTWSELIEVSTNYLMASTKPIVVGNELWWPCYGGEDLNSIINYIIKYNYLTDTVSSVDTIINYDDGYSCAEPSILEYSAGKYICALRVVRNLNYVGAESSNIGMILAYSTDGVDWSNYTFYNWGGQYPNQPRLIKYKDWIYLTRENTMYRGKPSVDGSEIIWYNRLGVESTLAQSQVYFMTFFAEGNGYLNRKDPRGGLTSNLVDLNRQGSMDICVVDEATDTLLATEGFKKDGSAFYIGEPWVSIIKKNSVKSDGTLTERLLFMTEIPRDSDTSNEINIHNSYALIGDKIVARWVDEANKDIDITITITANQKLKFLSSAPVTNAKIVYEIIKA